MPTFCYCYNLLINLLQFFTLLLHIIIRKQWKCIDKIINYTELIFGTKDHKIKSENVLCGGEWLLFAYYYRELIIYLHVIFNFTSS